MPPPPIFDFFLMDSIPGVIVGDGGVLPVLARVQEVVPLHAQDQPTWRREVKLLYIPL